MRARPLEQLDNESWAHSPSRADPLRLQVVEPINEPAFRDAIRRWCAHVVVSTTREEPEVTAEEVRGQAEDGPARARSGTLPVLLAKVSQEIEQSPALELEERCDGIDW